MPCIRFGSPADMMKAVSSALNANYSGKAWLKWFTTTAKAVIAELDASSATDGVRCSEFDFCCVSLWDCRALVFAS